MTATDPISFLSSLGLTFGLGFIGLTALSGYQMLQARQLAADSLEVVTRAMAQPAMPPHSLHSLSARAARDHATWQRLAALRGELGSAIARTQLTMNSIPSLALLGTVTGFFYAIASAGRLDLSSADPLAILQALMDGGIATALATTVLGQGLYLVLGQVWSFGVAGPVEDADSQLGEALELVRARMSWVDLAPAQEAP